jgi:hypothetical protein
MINTKLQSIIDTKSAIGNAIVNKGGTITGETPFFNYAAQIDGISTGTPQTIFTASDGSKWALTNAVNLVNDAGNVTSDFNYWQPANNSTSDPILNIGTVGANISGNIQLVPVNQVNIAQYVNIVATDTDGAKYEGFNGYDSVTNPTPTGNTTFNRWLLNNSATGTVLFANATFTTGTYNGPNTVINESNMAFIPNAVNYGSLIDSANTNNGFLYIGGANLVGTNRGVAKYYESNLVLVGNTANYGGTIKSIFANNGSLYVGGSVLNRVVKFNESSLSNSGQTDSYGGIIQALTVNDGFIYVGGSTNLTVQKFGESNLTRVGNTSSYGAIIFDLATNNSFVYAVGRAFDIKKYHESNLAFVANSAAIGTEAGADDIYTIKINNGFIFIAGGQQKIIKYHESNLVLVSNSSSYNHPIDKLHISNNFVYAVGYGNATSGRDIKKYHESNLAFVANSASYDGDSFGSTLNNGFLYVGGSTFFTRKYQTSGEGQEQLPFYNITTIKE